MNTWLVVAGVAVGAAATLSAGQASPRSRLRALAGGGDRSAGAGTRRLLGIRRLVGTGHPGADGVPVPVLLDLVAAVLSAGVPPSGAVRSVAEVLFAVRDPAAAALARLAVELTSPTMGLNPASPGGRGGSAGDVELDADARCALSPLTDALDLARATGLGPVGLVRAAAQDQRRRRAAAQIRAARRLSVLVVLPTGLCLLPAFILLTVVPLVLDLVLG